MQWNPDHIFGRSYRRYTHSPAVLALAQKARSHLLIFFKRPGNA